MTHQTSFAVVDASQAGEVRRAATRLAQTAGLSETTTGAVAIVASELATNLARYATGGSVHLRTVRRPGGVAVELLAVDRGPGMTDVQRCLQDGYSTRGTQGTGLGAVRRLSAQFDIHSTPEVGTVVLAQVGPPSSAGSRFITGVLSTPAPREDVCGDAWRLAESEEALAILLADGLGHGPLAAAAAGQAVAAFEEQPFVPPAQVCERAHRLSQGTRGSALAAVQVTAQRRLKFAGIGNISGTLIGNGQRRGLTSQNGTIGATVRRFQEFEYDWPAGGVLVLHSDGLTGRWSLDAYPGLGARHPAVIAGVLHRDFMRGRDDATVVVVRDAAPAPGASHG